MMNTNNRYKKTITESLKLLALPFDEQEKYFPEFVDVPFEVLDTFYHAMIQLPELIEVESFDNKTIASLLRLQNIINFTSSNHKFQDLEYKQFKMADEWNKVREMAKDILQVMGEPFGKPDTNYI